MQSLKISKQTQDKVKLAKKFIQNKYQSFLKEQQIIQSKWGQIYFLIKQHNVSEKDKLKIEKDIKEKLLIKKRMSRQKDCLANYELHKLIGRGAFGDVRIARNKATNQIVAIKMMDKKRLVNKKQISTAYIQRQIMIKNNSSRYLVNLYSTFQDNKYLYIVMQYIAGGDLLHLLIQKDIFSEEQTKFYIAQIVLAVQEIHSKNYIHRDIKPDNILITSSGHIKISDFGLSKYLELSQTNNNNFERKLIKVEQQHLKKLRKIKERGNRKFSKVGTPDYISPEVLTQETYDHSVDIWGIGVIMFESLFGYPPFSDDESQQVCHKVVNWIQYLQFPSDIKISAQAKDLISCLITDRKSRITIKQIKKHPFFHGINWQKLHLYNPPIIPKITHPLDTQNFQELQDFSNQKQKQILQVNLNQQTFLNNEFQKQNLQTAKIQNQQLKAYRKNRSRSQQIVFAGFQYKKNNINAFQESQKILKNMRKSHKTFIMNKSTKQKNFKIKKRLFTQGESQFNLLTKSFHNDIIPILKQEKQIKKISAKNFIKKDSFLKKA